MTFKDFAVLILWLIAIGLAGLVIADLTGNVTDALALGIIATALGSIINKFIA